MPEHSEVPVEFWLEDDGLTLAYQFELEERGKVDGKVTWPTIELAKENYEAARHSVLERIPKYAAQLESNSDGPSRMRVRTFAGGYLYWRIGAPTWWVPDLFFEREPLQVGFRCLRLSVSYSRDVERGGADG